MSSPEPITAPGIHDSDWNAVASAPRTQEQMRATGGLLVKGLLAQVLYAISGINILGVSVLDPFGLLRAFADDLVQTANDALAGSQGAQDSADYANGVIVTSLTSNVGGGVSLSALFNGSAAADFGASFTLASSGAGAGTYAPNGGGKAVWTVSGGLARLHQYRHVTVTTGDLQAVQMQLTSLPQAPLAGESQPNNYLRGRINAAGTSYAYLRIGRTDIQIGCYNAGVQHVFATPSVTVQTGVWRLQCGTTGDDHEFVVTRNGVEVWRGTDGGLSLVGASYRGVGEDAEAKSRNSSTTQSIPGDTDSWAAADYTAA